MNTWKTRLILVSLVASASLTLLARKGTAEEGSPDVVVLASGERVPCKIVRATRGRIHVEIGGRPYELESVFLQSIQAAGQPPVSPAAVRFARDLVLKLSAPSDEVVEAASAALRVLAKTHAPVLKGMAGQIRNREVREKLIVIASDQSSKHASSDGAPSTK